MNILRKGNLSEAEIMQWLIDMRAHCFVPESGYCVSCILRTPEGFYFAGVNVENNEQRLSTHAEEGAIAAMVAGLGKDARIAELWVMGAPKVSTPKDDTIFGSCCGKCRQQIAGLAEPAVKIHSVALNGKKISTTVGDFLPQAFAYFENKTSSSHAALSLQDIEHRMIRKTNQTEAEISQWLSNLNSILQFGKDEQSVVLKLDNGAYVGGTKVEDVAFCTMNAAMAALAIAVSEFGACRVERAWVRGHLKQEVLQTVLPLVNS